MTYARLVLGRLWLPRYPLHHHHSRLQLHQHSTTRSRLADKVHKVRFLHSSVLSFDRLLLGIAGATFLLSHSEDLRSTFPFISVSDVAFLFISTTTRIWPHSTYNVPFPIWLYGRLHCSVVLTSCLLCFCFRIDDPHCINIRDLFFFDFHVNIELGTYSTTKLGWERYVNPLLLLVPYIPRLLTLPPPPFVFFRF